MKKAIYLVAYAMGMLIAGSSIMLTGCTKEGPLGPAGKDGANGANGANGKDANSSCLVCHTSANMDAKLAEYKLSKHFLGTSSSRFGKYCARCHTNEGFQEITANGQFSVSNDIANATRISCETCHSHSAFNFTGDTAAFVLRTTTPVWLNYNKNLTTTDFGQINNLCVTCHQIRGATSFTYIDSLGKTQPYDQLPFFPFVNTDDNADVKYQVAQSFAVHDGNQSNLFTGINGYEYAGVTYTRTWKHSDAECVTCHMNEYNATTKRGGHSLLVNEEACTACHDGADKITPVQSLTEAKRLELAELLLARKVFKKTTNSSGVVSYSAVPSHDFYGTLFPTTASTDTYAISLTNVNSVDPKTGLVIYANSVKIAVDPDFALRIGRPWKYGELGAAYNYAYINSELSKGVHNPVYARELLQASIDWLNAHPAK
jgi:hypothetical protein